MGDVLDRQMEAIFGKPAWFDPTKETTWPDSQFILLDRATVERISKAYHEGRGTLVADAIRCTRTWIPNRLLAVKPSLMSWATTARTKGKYRWLEIAYCYAGNAYGVITIKLHDNSYPGATSLRWHQTLLHHSLASGNWRKTLAYEIRKMHKQALINHKNQRGRRAIGYAPQKLLGKQ